VIVLLGHVVGAAGIVHETDDLEQRIRVTRRGPLRLEILAQRRSNVRRLGLPLRRRERVAKFNIRY